MPAYRYLELYSLQIEFIRGLLSKGQRRSLDDKGTATQSTRERRVGRSPSTVTHVSLPHVCSTASINGKRIV